MEVCETGGRASASAAAAPRSPDGSEVVIGAGLVGAGGGDAGAGGGGAGGRPPDLPAEPAAAAAIAGAASPPVFNVFIIQATCWRT